MTWKQFGKFTVLGTSIRFEGGGFDVRNCPHPATLATHIATCVNNHERLVEMLSSIVYADSPENEWERMKLAADLLTELGVRV